MDDLRILIARLGWPTPSTRWWTMQELAARLGTAGATAETEAVLLQLLQSRKLEAEVVEVLCIFWMAFTNHGYAPSPELLKRVPRPSMLSNLFLEALGFAAQAIDADLEEAPEDFEIPNDFEGVQGVDMPRIFRTMLSRLELRTGLPLVRQMAFEWTKGRAAYPEAPLQGDFWHFVRPLGEGFLGQIFARAGLRAISAYLRTLAVAERRWRLPSSVAREHALSALPIHPTLASLKPSRPTWVPARVDFGGGVDEINTILQGVMANVAAERPGDELIAFSAPVEMTMGRCVEVSMVRWLQAGDSEVDDKDLAAHLAYFWRRMPTLQSLPTPPLDKRTWVGSVHIDRLLDEGAGALPLAGTLDFSRMGYLQLNLYPSRLFLPTLASTARTEVRPAGSGLEVLEAGQVVADYVYWNAGWGPVRPGLLGGSTGAALMSRGTAYREFQGAEMYVVRSFYLWQVRVLHRRNTHDSFGETLKSGIFSV